VNALNPCPVKGKKIKNFIIKKIFFYHQEALLQRDLLEDFAATEKNDNIFPIFSQTETRSMEYKGDRNDAARPMIIHA